jgi:hypothetical protein
MRTFAATVLLSGCVAATLAVPAQGAGAQRCPGLISIDDGHSSASKITARGLSCAAAKKAIAAPASKLGYTCKQTRAQASGGWIRCQRGPRTISFLYSTD